MKSSFKYVITAAVLLMIIAMPAIAETGPLINSATMHSVGDAPLVKQASAAPLVVAEHDHIPDIGQKVTASHQDPGDGTAFASVGSKNQHDGWDDRYQETVKHNDLARIDKVPLHKTAWLVLKKYH